MGTHGIETEHLVEPVGFVHPSFKHVTSKNALSKRSFSKTLLTWPLGVKGGFRVLPQAGFSSDASRRKRPAVRAERAKHSAIEL